MALIVRSRDRYTGTPSDFRLKLSERMQGRYRLAHAALSNTVFTFHETHSKFRFSYEGVTYDATIPYGFYDGNSICEALKDAMCDQIGTSNAVTVTYEPRLGRLRVTKLLQAIGQNNELVILGADASLAHSCMRSLGFVTNTWGDADGSVVADQIMDLSAPSIVYHVLINNTCSISSAHDGTHASFVFWNTETNSLGLWDYTQDHFTQSVLLREPTRELHIRIVDANFKPLPMQGEWSFVLQAC